MIIERLDQFLFQMTSFRTLLFPVSEPNAGLYFYPEAFFLADMVQIRATITIIPTAMDNPMMIPRLLARATLSGQDSFEASTITAAAEVLLRTGKPSILASSSKNESKDDSMAATYSGLPALIAPSTSVEPSVMEFKQHPHRLVVPPVNCRMFFLKSLECLQNELGSPSSFMVNSRKLLEVHLVSIKTQPVMQELQAVL